MKAASILTAAASVVGAGAIVQQSEERKLMSYVSSREFVRHIFRRSTISIGWLDNSKLFYIYHAVVHVGVPIYVY